MADNLEVAARLAKLDTCAISDALDKLALPGCVTGLISSLPGTRIFGRVHTVRLMAGPGPASGEQPRHLCTAAVAACSPGDVIVVEQRTGIDAGSWGGILSRGAKLRGIAGVVVDGPVRDVDEARELGFPLFCRSFTARTARGRIHEAATDVPVQIGDVTVRPRDYVVADSSAAVFIAQERVAEVLAAAEAIAAREAAMTQRLEAGDPITQVMGGDYEHMLRK